MNAELEQLRDDIRATAPEPRPEFAAELERRVEAGFKTAPSTRPARRRIDLFGPAVALACTAALAVVIGVAALGGGSGSDDDAGGGGDAAPLLAPEQDDSGATGGGAEPEAASRPPATSVAPTDSARRLAERRPDPRTAGGRRVVEQRTRLELLAGADRFDEVNADVLEVADDTGSIVMSSRVSERDGRGFARYDLRVPASRLDEALADLSRLAKVTSRTATSDDITGVYVSARDRLQDARAERQALLKALQNADTTAEADALRYRIRLARDRIVIAERDLAAVKRRADRAKVSVTVRSTGERSEGGAWTPGDALDDAGRILEVAAGVVLVSAAALLPLALVGLLAGLATRTLRRRRREAALGAR